MFYYAVANGRNNGIYHTWDECRKQVYKFKNAKYKKFSDENEANKYINDYLNLSKSEINNAKPDADLYIFTDGSCTNNGKENAVGGIGVYFDLNDNRNISEKIEGKITNNIAELKAIEKVYKLLTKDELENKQICIISDSKYAIHCLGDYGDSQEKISWTKSIPNKDLVKKVWTLYKDKTNIKFYYTKAHTDNNDFLSNGNREADRLAFEATTKLKSIN